MRAQDLGLGEAVVGRTVRDRLTGFLDRAGAIAEANRLCHAARQAESQLAVLWLGLDRFKQINESFGHGVGDELLAGLAERMRHYTGLPNGWARMSGDEFVYLIPEASVERAQSLAHQLLDALHAPLRVGQVRIRPSISMGVASLDEGESAVALLERADRAMIAAKRLGGARAIASGEEYKLDPGEQLLPSVELLLQEQLHAALEAGGLALHYQPVLRVDDGGLEAVEALMRCRAGKRLMPPAHFIPIAEKTGLIVRLGEWSLTAAARLVRRCSQTGVSLKVAVNISRAQITSDAFIPMLRTILASADVSPANIELELTESLFMDAAPQVRKNLDAAREAGFALAIDDFGTGYSCLAYLKDLPAQKLKLDRAFVMGLPHDRKAHAIARTICQLARDLGMRTVAEGVESPEQLDALREMGVDTVQGFLFARPMDEGELREWLVGRA